MKRSIPIAFLLLFILVEEGAFTHEADHEKLVPEFSKEAFDVQNFYFCGEGRLNFPIGFTGEEKLTGFGLGLTGEIGYDMDGWLVAARLGYEYYYEGFNEEYLMNYYSHFPITFEISKIFGKHFIPFLPSWLDIRPMIGFGADIYTANYYQSLVAKENDETMIKHGGMYLQNIGVAGEYNKGIFGLIPFCAFNLDMAIDRSGLLLMPSLSIGLRSPLGRGTPKIKPAPVVETPKVEPKTIVNPNVSLSSDHIEFTPDEDGVNDTETFKLFVDCGTLYSNPDDWKIELFTPDKVLFKTFSGTGVVPETIEWDGIGDNGEKVKEDTVYSAVLSVNAKATENNTVKTGDSITFTSQSYVHVGTLVKPKSIVNPEFVIQMAKNAFTPDGDGTDDSVSMNVKAIYGTLYSEPVDWKFEVRNSSGALLKTINGVGAVPDTINWDGKTDTEETLVSDTDYPTKLTVTAKATENDVKESVRAGDTATYNAETLVHVGTLIVPKVFVQPEFSFDIPQKDFTPDEDGVDDSLVAIVHAVYGSDYENPVDWKFEIVAPSKTVFKTISGTGAVPETITWDGKSESGETVQSATEYPAKLTVNAKALEDNKDGTVKAGDSTTYTMETKINVGILVEKMEDGQLKILVPSISFDPNAATFNHIGEEAIAKNNQILDQVTEILKKYDTYKIAINGHANNTSGTENEEINELIPLSKARAEAIKAEIVLRGVDGARITTEGKGGRFPVSTDKAEGWKNRRVEFILKK